MGFFSKLKKNLTGGWADVSLEVEPVHRGGAMGVRVEVDVRGEPIEIQRVYVMLRCIEEIDIRNYSTGKSDAQGKPIDVHVEKSNDLLNDEITLAGTQHLDANSHYQFEGEVPIPAHLPASFIGNNARVKWSAYAGLDMKGNDPDTSWQELTVE